MIALVLAALATVDPAVIDVREHLGASVPIELPFNDERGRPVRLGDYFDGDRPVLLVLAYFECPMLCGLVLNGAAQAVSDLSGWHAGADFRVVTVSFDPHDGPYEARQKQASVLGARGGAPERWPFLTGRQESIAALTDALGFVAVRDEGTGQFAHPAVVFVLTPDGRLSRYLYGISYSARDVKLALIEASAGAIASPIEHVLMRCYAYDPATRRYGLYVAGVMRVFGALSLLCVGGALAFLWQRRRRP